MCSSDLAKAQQAEQDRDAAKAKAQQAEAKAKQDLKQANTERDQARKAKTKAEQDKAKAEAAEAKAQQDLQQANAKVKATEADRDAKVKAVEAERDHAKGQVTSLQAAASAAAASAAAPVSAVVLPHTPTTGVGRMVFDISAGDSRVVVGLAFLLTLLLMTVVVGGGMLANNMVSGLLDSGCDSLGVWTPAYRIGICSIPVLMPSIVAGVATWKLWKL